MTWKEWGKGCADREGDGKLMKGRFFFSALAFAYLIFLWVLHRFSAMGAKECQLVISVVCLSDVRYTQYLACAGALIYFLLFFV